MRVKKTMSCSDVTVLLSRHQDNELAAETRAIIDAHLQTCASCQKEWLELQETVAMVKQLPEVETDSYFTARVMGNVMEKAKKPSWGMRWFPLPSSPVFSRVVYSSVFIIFLVLGFLLMSINSTLFHPGGTTETTPIQQELQLVKVLVESQDLSLINVQDKTFALLVNGSSTGNGDSHEK